MIPRASRLPYEEFRARGYREMATPYFSVKVRKNSLRKNRFGIVIGVAAIKSAARRNFWRRQAKSVFLEMPQRGMDVLIILHSRVALPVKSIFRKSLGDAIISLLPQII
jgi:ribonuclease P protein component